MQLSRREPRLSKKVKRIDRSSHAEKGEQLSREPCRAPQPRRPPR